MNYLFRYDYLLYFICKRKKERLIWSSTTIKGSYTYKFFLFYSLYGNHISSKGVKQLHNVKFISHYIYLRLMRSPIEHKKKEWQCMWTRAIHIHKRWSQSKRIRRTVFCLFIYTRPYVDINNNWDDRRSIKYAHAPSTYVYSVKMRIQTTIESYINIDNYHTKENTYWVRQVEFHSM